MIWTASHPPPPTRQWPFIGGRTNVPIKILHQPQARVSQRFQQSQWIRTEAILSLDDDAAISTEEVDFAFGVWLHFSDRLVGFPSRSHFWDDRKHQWVSFKKKVFMQFEKSSVVPYITECILYLPIFLLLN